MNEYQKNRDVIKDDQTSSKATNINSKDMNLVKLKDLRSLIKNLSKDEVLVVDLQGEKNVR